ncbi:MAG: peptide-methionine (S)-S-oxide reductase MsrA [Acidobacteria bacterium]|nr:peptide-methionine (S)-S-oxide reductase MsrA [Acidobacteriota bacterium]
MNRISRSARSAALLALCLAFGTAHTFGQPKGASAASATATFAGGCFWCMEPPFDALDGVISTTSGYIGGETKSPTYEQVSGGQTGHTEALQIVYDPAKVTYARLLEVFWRNVDAVDGGGQFCDRGPQYRPAIFHHSEEQKQMADTSKQRIAAQLGRPIPVQIVAADTFYKAEEYHQDYYKKNPARYKFYKWNCGRDQRLEKLWGKAPTQ